MAEGFGVGLAEGLQIAQNLQIGEVEKQQKEVALQQSQIQLQGLKVYQNLMSDKSFQADMASGDPSRRNHALYEAADALMAGGMIEQGTALSTMVSDQEKNNAYITEQKSLAIQRKVESVRQAFAGVTNEQEWRQAQILAQSSLDPQDLQVPAIKQFMSGPYDPNKIRILPEYLDRMKILAQKAADEARARQEDAAAKKDAVDELAVEARADRDAAQAAFLRKETGGGKSNTDDLISAELTENKVNLGIGSRSPVARQQIIDGLKKKYPQQPGEDEVDWADRIGKAVAGRQLAMVGREVEIRAVATREGGIAGAQQSLTRQGGLYDQLNAAASKVDFGDSRTMNWIRQGLAKKVYANPQIKAYVTTLVETRADLASALARGRITDQAREQAAEALPDNITFHELGPAIKASREAVNAVMGGNQDVIDALAEGKSIYEALGRPDPRTTFANEAAVKAAYRAGRVKKGQTVTVAGQEMTIQ